MHVLQYIDQNLAIKCE